MIDEYPTFNKKVHEVYCRIAPELKVSELTLIPTSNELTPKEIEVKISDYIYTINLCFMIYMFFDRDFIWNTLYILFMQFIKCYTFVVSFYQGNIKKKYIKYVKPFIYNLCNIDNNEYEIRIIKNGREIYKYKSILDFANAKDIKYIIDEDYETTLEKVSNYVNENESTESTDTAETTETTDTAKTTENTETTETTETTEKIEQETNNKIEHDEDLSNIDAEKEFQNYFNPEKIVLDCNYFDFVLRTFYDEDGDDCLNYTLKYDCFRLSDLDWSFNNLPALECNKHFIGVELKTNNICYEINIRKYYNFNIDQNVIFDYAFLKWYMNTFYNVELSKEYEITCIDNMIQVYKLSPGSALEIMKDGYRMVKDFSIEYNYENEGKDYNLGRELEIESEEEEIEEEYEEEEENENDMENKVKICEENADVEIINIENN